MQAEKSHKSKLNKPVLGELHESFFKKGKMFEDYYIGDIKYEDGSYTFHPTSSDEAYTEEEKLKILQGIIEGEVVVSTQNGPVTKTKDDSDYLEAYATQGNMYGGLSIVNDGGEHDKAVKDLTNLKQNHDNKRQPKLVVSKTKNIS